MRAVLLGLVALALPAAEPVYAADLLGLRPALPEPGVPESSDFNWTGTYASGYVGVEALKSTATELGSNSGANAANCASAAQFAAFNAANGLAAPAPGTYWCNINMNPKPVTSPVLSYNQIGNKWSETSSGLTGGFGVGYLYQFPKSHWVLGAEADFNYLGNSKQSGTAPGTDDTTLDINASYFGTARLVAGYAQDRWLAYGTAGLAWGEFGGAVQDMDTPVGIRTSPTGTQWGFALGAGGAYALTDHWIVKGEYLAIALPYARTSGYANLSCGYDGQDAGVCSSTGPGNWKTGAMGNPLVRYDWKVSQMLNLARFGLSYKF